MSSLSDNNSSISSLTPLLVSGVAGALLTLGIQKAGNTNEETLTGEKAGMDAVFSDGRSKGESSEQSC